ncbi:ABC transporter permease [bacterium]|nr:ABC transporter permease [bacterium]
MMLKNYLKIAVRNLVKHKKFTAINILGLAIGLTCFILIMLWVQDELSYDRFHKRAENIYLVLRNDNNKLSAVTTKMLAPALKADLPEVIEATSVGQLPESFKAYFQYQNKGFEENITLVESQFFNIFSFDFKEGDPWSAFQDPNCIVMTERMCRKYFGEGNPIGESITMTLLGQKRIMKVTGILENLPRNSSFKREMMASIDLVETYGGVYWDSWSNQNVHTYIHIQENADIHEIEKKAMECKRRHYREDRISYVLHPLTKIHLRSGNIAFFSAAGDIKYVTIFSVIGGIILLIACINYMNLNNALSLKRAREIGIQKVVGAQRPHLIQQYFGETFIITLIALGCALLMVELLIPVLNQLSGKSLFVNFLSLQFLFTILFTIIITSVVSGLYPAFFISGFQPVQVIKGRFQHHKEGFSLQRGLIIFQFSMSIIIIVCTLIVFNQLKYIQNSNLGYNKDNMVCLKVKGDISGQYDIYKNKLLENPNILSVCRSQSVEAGGLGKTESVHWMGKQGKFTTWVLHVDFDFAESYKIKMKSGRFFSDQFVSDQTSSYLLNEAAAEEMGLESPVGTDITFWSGRPGKIIGIVKDFHFSTLHHVIEPMIIRIPDPDPEEENMFYRIISIRLQGNSIRQSLAYIENMWRDIFPAEPFDFYFLDEKLNAGYQAEQRMGTLFNTFSFLAILIACLGLYGLTAFTIEQKFKDIGVHKVLGASVLDIIFLISKNYLLWIVFSNVIAWPVTYYVMNQWLENFAYRINIGWWTFLLAGAIALVIALITVSWQAIRAATANPVEALRYE